MKLATLPSAPLKGADVAKLVASSPATLLEILRAARTGAARSVRAEVAWAVNNVRVRAQIPDAATGVVWHGERAFVEALRSHLRPSADAVEVGCGGGRIGNLVASEVGSLCCSDISATLLNEARANLAEHPNVTFAKTSGLDLKGLPSDSFDLAFAHDVLINLEPDASLALLDAMRRVLRPGGACVVSVYTTDRPEWAEDQLARIRLLAPKGELGTSHPRMYFADQLARMFELAGFGPVDGSYDESVADRGRAHYIVAAATR